MDEQHHLKIINQEIFLDNFKIKRASRARIEVDIEPDGASVKLFLEMSVNPEILLDHFGDDSRRNLNQSAE